MRLVVIYQVSKPESVTKRTLLIEFPRWPVVSMYTTVPNLSMWYPLIFAPLFKASLDRLDFWNLVLKQVYRLAISTMSPISMTIPLLSNMGGGIAIYLFFSTFKARIFRCMLLNLLLSRSILRHNFSTFTFFSCSLLALSLQFSIKSSNSFVIWTRLSALLVSDMYSLAGYTALLLFVCVLSISNDVDKNYFHLVVVSCITIGDYYG